MRNNDINEKLKNAFERLTPDVLDSVLSKCEEQKGRNFMTENIKMKKRPIWTKIAGLAAAVAICVAGGMGFSAYKEIYGVASTVSLDVNPSIEITINKKEAVIDVIPKNEKAVDVIGDMKLGGSDVNVAVNAVVGSMLRKGYINSDTSSILITVDDKDEKRAEALQTSLTTGVKQVLDDDDTVEGAVISQNIKHSKELKEIADANSISEGKAHIINGIIENHPTYKFEDLAGLSINELNLIGAGKVAGVKIDGNASETKYIGTEKARSIAVNHASVNEKEINRISSEFEYEDGRMTYDVEFIVGNAEYEYHVDAVTGEIVKFEIDKDDLDDIYEIYDIDDDDHDDDHIPTATAVITPDEAKSIASSHSKVSTENMTKYKCELDIDDGLQKYEIEFKHNGVEYDYEIDAVTGKVLKAESDMDDDYDD